MVDLEKMLEELKGKKEVIWVDQYNILKEVDVVGIEIFRGEVTEEVYGNVLFGYEIGSPKNGIAEVKEGKHSYDLSLVSLNGPWISVEVDPHLGFYNSGKPRKSSESFRYGKIYPWIPPEITFKEKKLIVDASKTILAPEWVSVYNLLLGKEAIYAQAKAMCEENYIPFAPYQSAIKEAILKVVPKK